MQSTPRFGPIEGRLAKSDRAKFVTSPLYFRGCKQEKDVARPFVMAKRTRLQRRFLTYFPTETALQMPRIRTRIDKRAVDAIYTQIWAK